MGTSVPGGSGPGSSGRGRRGAVVTGTVVGVVAGLLLGVGAWWFFLGDDHAPEEATDERTDTVDEPVDVSPAEADVAHACLLLSGLPEEIDPAELGPLDEDPTVYRMGAIHELLAAASVEDPAWTEMSEHAREMLDGWMRYDVELINDGVTDLRSACAAAGH